MTDETHRALDALRQAVAEALERKQRLGLYAVIWQDGQPVEIRGEELAVAARLAKGEPGA